MLETVASYHCMQFQGTNEPNFRKWQKTYFQPNLVHLAQIRVDKKKKKNLLKNLAPSVTRYYGHLSSCTISEKTNDPILRELKDGRTDGQTDNFIGYCLTVECPIKCP